MATIRLLGPEDWEEFRDIRMRALADAPTAFGMTLANAETTSDQEWQDRLSQDPVLVVRHDGVAVALGAGWVHPGDPPLMMVWGMWTAPEARGRGYGEALVRWLLGWARERGIGEVQLHVTEGNDVARRLYERCGFRATGEWEPLREGSDLRIERLRRHP